MDGEGAQAHPLPFVANNGKAAKDEHKHKRIDTLLKLPKTKAENRMENRERERE